MKFGHFSVSTVNHGFLRLDGGAMFGSVPKNIWAKLIAPDGENCIRLATRSLIIRDNARTFLVDVGMGEKWGEKQRKIYGIENTPPGERSFEPGEITDIILTHLHFDHAGGISLHDSSGNIKLAYPKARVFLQRANFENALNPGLRERASYLKENTEILREANLTLLDGSTEIAPGIWCHPVHGHTRGQQYIEIRSKESSILYPTDLIPTSHHLPLPYTMGYDICAETLLGEKQAFLEKAIERDAIVVFEHDPEIKACRVGRNERGHYCVRETVEI